jgi:hypothetical protein
MGSQHHQQQRHPHARGNSLTRSQLLAYSADVVAPWGYRVPHCRGGSPGRTANDAGLGRTAPAGPHCGAGAVGSAVPRLAQRFLLFWLVRLSCAEPCRFVLRRCRRARAVAALRPQLRVRALRSLPWHQCWYFDGPTDIYRRQ